VKVLDLFSGEGGWTSGFGGHEVFSVDWDPYYEADLVVDILKLSIADLPWPPDIILASPPCERFSVARARQWGQRGTEDIYTKRAVRQVRRTVHLIQVLKPKFFVIENPVGLLRHLGLIPYEMRTITQCQYGRSYMKRTDLWGGFPHSLKLKPMCRNGEPCHERAPRGTLNGAAGVGYNIRAMIPQELSLAVCRAAERDLQLFEAPAS
jgi:C-5 cytosine-specific DNA methylase